VDTCVFPRTKKWLGPIIDGAKNGVVIPIWSPLIIAEVNRFLTWRWLKLNDGNQGDTAWKKCSEASKIWFSNVTAVFRVIDDHPPYEQTWSDHPRDIWDIPIWTAAIRAQQSYRGAPVFVVTDNLRDGPPKDEHGLQYHRDVGFIHPEQFAQLIDAWADLMYTGEARRRPPQAERQPTGDSPTFQLAGVALPPEIEELLRAASARLPHDPTSADLGPES